MSIFSTLDRDWSSLPVLTTLDGLALRWAGPLVDLGHDWWLSDMSQAAWGYLEFCGWAEAMPEGKALDADGNLKHNTDFRSVIGTVVHDWFGVEQTAVLPREYPILPLIRKA